MAHERAERGPGGIGASPSAFCYLAFPMGAASPVVIAVDSLGGESASAEPAEFIRGVAAVSLEAPHIETILVGDSERITSTLATLRHDPERIAVHHTTDFVRPDENPEEAMAARPDCSVLAATRLAASGRAAAVVSAGSSAAAIAACLKAWRLIPGVQQPALGAVYPTALRRGEKDDPFSLLLDVGASEEASPHALVQFALMGSAYAARVSRNPRPRVALLSTGAELSRRPKEIAEAHRLFRQHTTLNFIGHVEGVDVPKGAADVVVCSGFLGNVVLKMLEGVSETVIGLARYAYKERLAWRLGLRLLSGSIHQLKRVTDWDEYGGAPLLGFDRIFLKAHGQSQARAITNAIKVAARAVQGDVTTEIAQAVQVFDERMQARWKLG